MHGHDGERAGSSCVLARSSLGTTPLSRADEVIE
jgi:hypothetical protein